MSFETLLPLIAGTGIATKSLSKEIFKKWKDIELDNDYWVDFQTNLSESLNLKSSSLKRQLNKIIQAYESESLVLVLGAGVSVEYNLPNWDTLLQKLLLSSFQKETSSDSEKSLVLAKLFTKLFSPNPLIAARYLRNHYKENSKGDINSFEKAVRKSLYENIKKNYCSPLFSEIIQLCVAPGKTPNLNSIITYNYDDILEHHLKELNITIPHKTISSVGMKPSTGELPIYHVHGYLARTGRIGPSSLVTLSEDEYHQQYSDTYSWNNIVQINKFRDTSCLFIGLSLSDPNIRRLLDIANTQRGSEQPQHFSIRKRYNTDQINKELKELLSNDPELIDEKSGAKLQINETIKTLVKVIESFETKDDYSFGISTIWVDSYEQITQVIKAIREKNTDVKLQIPKK